LKTRPTVRYLANETRCEKTFNATRPTPNSNQAEATFSIV